MVMGENVKYIALRAMKARKDAPSALHTTMVSVGFYTLSVNTHIVSQCV